MLEYTSSDQSLPGPIQIENNENLMNIITRPSQANLIYYNSLMNLSTEKDVSYSCTENKNRSIFVCTFCQVFAFSDSAIAKHIANEHGHSLKEGTGPENYVSKLQALKKDKSTLKKRGRPQKNANQNKKSSTVKDEEAFVSTPSLGSDGLYWCKKCHRNFKKLRQISRHVCCPAETQEDTLEDCDTDYDDSCDFKTYMDVQPTPWSRLKHRKNIHIEPHQTSSSENSHSLGEINASDQDEEVKLTPNWREDPSYVPLFNKESEKSSYKEHLKSIDYSSIDFLFDKFQEKSKIPKKNSKTPLFKYFCIVCHKECKRLSHIRMHCLIHTDLKPFTCPKCPYRTNVKAGLHTHMRSHTGNVFRCSKCNYLSNKRSHLLEHEQTHSIDPVFCKLCKNNYKTLKSLIFHIKKYHNNVSGKKYVKSLSHKNSNSIVVKCELCCKSFTSYSSLDIHKKNDHSVVILPKDISENCEIINIIPEEHYENININDVLSMPTFLDCSVMIEPLDDQLINYLQFDFKCNICDQKFPSQTLLEDHTLLIHSPIITAQRLDAREIQKKISENALEVDNFPASQIFPNPENALEVDNFPASQIFPNLSECSVRLEPLDDQLVELMLNNIFKEKDSPNVELFDTVFPHSDSSDLLPSNTILSGNLSTQSTPKKLLPLSNINEFNFPNPSLLEECQKNINIDILDECLRQSNIAEEVITDASYKMSESSLSSNRTQQATEFGLPVIGLPFSNSQLISEALPEDSMKNILQLGTELVEPKSEEIKLFERCRRAPAYVCCVCSSIFICPSTLKAHLKEHINKSKESNSNIVEQPVKEYQPTNLSDRDEALDDVCRILQDPGPSNSDADTELEKLYACSLDKMWYLPEVSVVLENDKALFDAALEDNPNFPINDKFDESENLQLESEIFS